ncbi:MAG: TetM/TetW/TetO/TetS family tetracycline resistance ribosomal protection protein [Nocardioidaceae bacterium]|nr:TetM/TetW/TetO/TetS family tetracycline resistance ribosomal protection protein [Nocardioidaceae bacterium]
MPTLNLGIVAHVDAGKTTLTERLLFETGVTTHIGRVDHGDTATDTDSLERQRGITIRSAVVTFTVRPVDGACVKVNLIDTPGHSDFVAEVERALAVLDGAVLVVSAVEGVQPQTRVLIRILERLHIPFLIFANKIDRVGAKCDETMAAIREALTGDAVALTRPTDLGTRSSAVRPCDGAGFLDDLVERLAECDDRVLRRYVDGAQPFTEPEALACLARHTANGNVHPVYFGSALTGIGVADIIDGLGRYLPAGTASADGTLHATVFKIERGPAGHKVAFARLHTGTLTARDRVVYHHRSPAGTLVEREGMATGIDTFTSGAATAAAPAKAGEIAKVVGLPDIEIGDQLGPWDPAKGGRHFAPPGLEAVVLARNPADRPALFEALRQLSEQDPLIDARLDGIDQELTVSLYGEVQKEVLAARLATEFGVEAEFLPTQTVYVERVSGVGEAFEQVPTQNATLGLRVEPGQVGSGVDYRLAVERGWLLPSFHTAVEETLPIELRVGLFGWRVTDCMVTLTQSRYCAPTPPAGYFRWLTSVVLRGALRLAGTTVCAPVSEFEVEIPSQSISQVLQVLHAAGATPGHPEIRTTRCHISGAIPTDQVGPFEQRLPGLSHGEGFFSSRPAGYRPVQGPPPMRAVSGTGRAARPT